MSLVDALNLIGLGIALLSLTISVGLAAWVAIRRDI